MLKRSVVISLFLAVVAAAAALAAGGGLTVRMDRSFGRHGEVELKNTPTYRSTAFTALTVQPDGSLLATRETNHEPGGITRRYTAAGRVDPSFAPTSAPARTVSREAEYKLQQTLGVPGFEIEQILPLSSGKSLLAGIIVTHLPAEEGAGPTLIEAAVARLGADGLPDPIFGTGGIVRFKIDLGIAAERLLAVEPGPEERVIAVVHDKPASFRGAAAVHSPSSLVALDGAGRLDPSFAGGAIRMPGTIEGFRVRSDGSILVAGEQWGERISPRYEAGRSDLFVSRFTAVGQLDPTFAGGDGTLVLDLAGIDLVRAALWDEDGSIWLGGAASRVESADCRRFANSCPETPFVVRVTAAGALDPGFGRRGVLRLDELASPYGVGTGGEGVIALAARPGGGIYAAGGSGTVAFIAALTPGGRLNPRFADDGLVVETDPAAGSSAVNAVMVDGRGRLLVAGGTNAGVATPAPAGALFRFEPNGRLDRTFGGGDGHVRLPRRGNALALGSDGSAFVLSGRFVNIVTKVGPGGRPDRSFGEEGTAVLPEAVTIPWRGRRLRLHVQPKSIAALPGGGVLVAGTAGKEQARAVIFRLRVHGGLDRSFGNQGVAIPDCGRNARCRVEQMALQRDGGILLVGQVEPRPYEYRTEALAVMRLLPDGGMDPGFGRKGLAVRRIGKRSYGSALAVDRGDGILVSGRTVTDYRVREVLLRLRSDGRIDRGFGRGGVVSHPVLDFRHGIADRSRQVLLLGGRILVLRDSPRRQLVTYLRGGRSRRAFSVADGAEVAVPAGRAPVGAVQDGRLVLGWQVPDRPGKHIKLQRLILGQGH